MEPLISVIVPVYNVEPYLRKCVDSILNQTYRNLEVILVDDGSPDGCPEICDEYSQKDERIRVIHKENGGLSDARNAGLRVMTGAYVTLVDSDDWIDLGLYESVMQYAPFDVAVFGFTYVDAETGEASVKPVCDAPRKLCWDRDIETVEMLIRNSMFGYACNKVYRRDILKGLSYPDVRLREDLLFNLRGFGRADEIQLINSEGYFYLQHNQSLLRKKYTGDVPNIADAAVQMMIVHPCLPQEVNRRLANSMIKQYICDSAYKFIFQNRTLSEADAIEALRGVFRNKAISDFLIIKPTEGRLFSLLAVCMKLRSPKLFYKLMRRKWHE